MSISFFLKLINFKSLTVYRKFLPLVIKPISGGSSVEINILNNEDDLKNVKDKIFSNLFIVEPLVGNRELTVSVLDNKPLVVTEIISKKNFFYDYNSKYYLKWFFYIYCQQKFLRIFTIKLLNGLN